MRSGIYLIVNSVNHKEYAGKSKNVKSRMHQHLKDLRRGNHQNPHMQNAWNLYGEDSFVFVVVEYCDPAYLVVREDWWIETLELRNSEKGYNLKKANGSEISDQTRARMSAAATGRVFTPETKEKMSAARKGVYVGQRHPMYGKQHTKASREKMSQSLSGRKMPDGFALQHSERLRNKPKPAGFGERVALALTGKSYPSRRSVNLHVESKWFVSNPTGHTIIVDNLSQFCRDMELHSSAMYAVARGQNSHHKGWTCERVLNTL